MLVTFRSAEPADVPRLVELYGRAYRGGYSACFDRYGLIGPKEFWWVQAEKSVYLLEVNRKAEGMIVLGRTGGRLLVEEVLGESTGSARGVAPLGDVDAVLLGKIYEFLLHQFHREHQDWMTLRAVETNTLALSLARRYEFTFANALVVVSAPSHAPAAALPGEYTMRRASREDAHAISELHQDCFHALLPSDELQATLRRPQTRAFIVEREHYAVGFGMLEAKDGAGQWCVGVRESHRRKGVGTALAVETLGFADRKGVAAIGTYWALEPAVSGFCQRLQCATERTYLYLEKRI